MPEFLLTPEIKSAAPSAECLQLFTVYLAREPDPEAALRHFLDLIADSDEPMEEWLRAFEVFSCFIESTEQVPTLTQALGYLKCCQSVSHTGARYATFPMTVEVMLETYGYTGQAH